MTTRNSRFSRFSTITSFSSDWTRSFSLSAKLCSLSVQFQSPFPSSRLPRLVSLLLLLLTLLWALFALVNSLKLFRISPASVSSTVACRCFFMLWIVVANTLCTAVEKRYPYAITSFACRQPLLENWKSLARKEK